MKKLLLITLITLSFSACDFSFSLKSEEDKLSSASQNGAISQEVERQDQKETKQEENIEEEKKDNQVYEYSKPLENPFTGESYQIRTQYGTFCGMSDSPICDLVKVNSDQDEVIADLFFADRSTDDDRLRVGAELVEFISEDVLLIKYQLQDHGGGFEYLTTYNLATKEIAELAYFSFSPSAYSGNDFYALTLGDLTIYFISHDDSYEYKDLAINEQVQENGAGIYISEGSVTKKLEVEIERPYKIAVEKFDLVNSLKNPQAVKLNINAEDWLFNFETSKLEKQ
jgi:hypothetical protein